MLVRGPLFVRKRRVFAMVPFSLSDSVYVRGLT